MNKTNEGCVKIFNFLKLLHNNEATYENVQELFKEDLKRNPSRSYAHIVINKYMNALKVFGIKIIKENNCYKIKNNLYSMNYTKADLQAISMLIKAVQEFPDEKIQIEVEKFLFSLKLRMNPKHKVLLDKFLGDYDFSFYYSKLKDQIEHCQKVCQDEFIFEIIYLEDGKQKSLKKCKPIEVLYDSQNAYFKLYSPQKNMHINVPVSEILTIKTMPQKAQLNDISTTVIYNLKGRLAKTYKLKDNETSPGRNENGEMIVINKNEPINVLLARLMRYMDLCEIQSPKFVRDQMIELIDSTILKYSNLK